MQKTENSRICILLLGPQEGLKTSKRYCFTAPDGSWVGISGLSKDFQNQEWPGTKRTIENQEDTRLTKEGWKLLSLNMLLYVKFWAFLPTQKRGPSDEWDRIPHHFGVVDIQEKTSSIVKKIMWHFLTIVWIHTHIYRCMCSVLMCSCSVVSDSATPWAVAHQAPLSVGFLRQEYWSFLPFPPPGDLSDPEIERASPALAGRFFTSEPSGKPYICVQ